MQETVTNSAQETQQFASEYLEKYLKHNVLALYGDLGSGKTTFVQGLAKALGITEQVTSPTFILMRSYDISRKDPDFPRKLYHVDLYRVKDWEGVEMLGLAEIWSDFKNLVVIEWPEKLENYLPKERDNLKFEYLDKDKRLIR